LDASLTTIAILLIGGTVLLAFASDALAQRFRIPDVLWLILFGLLAGPVFHLVQPGQVSELGGVLGTVALVVILYDAGIDFNPKEARAVGTAGVLLSVGSFALAFGVLFVVGLYAVAGGDLLIALLFALCLAGVSGAVVLPIARRLGFSPTIRDTLHLDMAIEDTLSVLSVTVLLSVIATQNPGWTSIVPQVLLPLPEAIAFGVLGGFIATEFLSRWQRRTYAGLATMGILFVVYGATEGLGGSGVMAALIMGVVLGNDAFFRRWLPRSSGQDFAFDPAVRQVHNEIAFVLRAIFLVILGILVPFQPLGIVTAIAVVALPFLLLLARRWLLMRLEHRTLVEPGNAARLSNLYGRGLTNAVLLILAIEALPAMQSVLLPAFLVIIGTDVVMTVLVFLEPNPDAIVSGGGGGVSDPLDPFRPRGTPLSSGEADARPPPPLPRPPPEPSTPSPTAPSSPAGEPVTSRERPARPGSGGGPPRTGPGG
jgi:NhaP-type Na+/H+ or K+/H+ antiporter